MAEETTNLKRRIPEWMRCGSCSEMSRQQVAVMIGTVALGVFKGILMLPFVMVINLLAVFVINIISFWPTIDFAYLAARFVKYIGPNLKKVIYVTIPFVYLIYFVVTPFLVAILTVGFCLIYPAYVTLHAQRQSAFRFILLTSGWPEMFRMTGKNIEAYNNFFTVYVPAKAVAEARKHHEGEPYDIHPGNLALAFLMLVFGGTAMAVVLLLLIIVKVLPIMARAYANHARSAATWFHGGSIVMILAYFGYYLIVPVLGALSLPVAFCYGYVVGYWSAVATVQSRGLLMVSIAVFRDNFMEVNKGTTKYIFNQDVPFVILPSANPIHFSWLVAGFIPLICGLVCNSVILLFVAIVSWVPCTGRAYVETWKRLQMGGSAAKPKNAILLYLLLAALPAITTTVIVLLCVKAVLDHTGVFMVTNKSKNLQEGFRFIFGINYRYEYTLNAFAYRTNPRDKVHWASLLPCFREWARPYMHPAEFDYSSRTPISVVTQPTRYRPAGLRKPKRDAEGRIIDMSRAGYHIPGVGMAPIINGEVGPVIPTKPGAPLPAGTQLPAELVKEPGQTSGGGTPGTATPVPTVAPATAPVAKPRRGCMCMNIANIDEADAPPLDEAEEVVGADAEAGAEGDADADADPALSPSAAEAGGVTSTADVRIDVRADASEEGAKPTLVVSPPTPGGVSVGAAKEVVPASLASARVEAATVQATAVPTPRSATEGTGTAAVEPPPSLSPAHDKATNAVKRAHHVLQAAATAAAMAKAAREARNSVAAPAPVDSSRQAVSDGSSATRAAPEVTAPPTVPPALDAVKTEEPTPSVEAPAPVVEARVDSKPALAAPVSKVYAPANDDTEDGDDDDDDDMFVLMPVVRPDLADEWVPVTRDGETYYVNYARNQSNWSIPPGY